MLNRENLDLVLILSPSGLHFKHAKYAMEKGMNVLSEKPMSLKVHHCKELIKISMKKKVFFGVVYQNRLNNAIQFLRKEIHGNINHITLTHLKIYRLRIFSISIIFH